MKTLTITVPENLHPATAAAVRRFAVAMAAKLEKAQLKYGYQDDWKRSEISDLQQDLQDHFDKGDPLDVANFCMFLWARGAGVHDEPST